MKFDIIIVDDPYTERSAEDSKKVKESLLLHFHKPCEGGRVIRSSIPISDLKEFIGNDKSA